MKYLVLFCVIYKVASGAISEERTYCSSVLVLLTTTRQQRPFTTVLIESVVTKVSLNSLVLNIAHEITPLIISINSPSSFLSLYFSLCLLILLWDFFVRLHLMDTFPYKIFQSGFIHVLSLVSSLYKHYLSIYLSIYLSHLSHLMSLFIFLIHSSNKKNL